MEVWIKAKLNIMLGNVYCVMLEVALLGDLSNQNFVAWKENIPLAGKKVNRNVSVLDKDSDIEQYYHKEIGEHGHAGQRMV
jgi:hypothetical protein